MTKAEIIEALTPFTDNAEVVVAFSFHTGIAKHLSGWKYDMDERGRGHVILVAELGQTIIMKRDS